MIHEKTLSRLNQLIEQGGEVLHTTHIPEYGGVPLVDAALFTEWKAASLSFLSTVFGGEHSHSTFFSESCQHESEGDSTRGLAILKAAKSDIESGFLISIEQLVAADIFTDLLEMATHLLKLGYKDPAASLTGAVLENGLRKISRAHKVKLKHKEDISSLNHKLLNAKIYNRLVFKNIQAWAELRNSADHGQFEEYDKAQVSMMLDGVQRFLAEYLKS